MPNYDFHCPSCGLTFEQFLAIADRARDDVACPRCKHVGAERAVSAPHIGSGQGGTTVPYTAPT